MPFMRDYPAAEPAGGDVEAQAGWQLLEFGAPWCGHCQAAKPLIEAALARYPGLRFIWVEDGRGRPLGRSFGVKLWPTLVFLKDGREIERLVRPVASGPIEQALARIATVL